MCLLLPKAIVAITLGDLVQAWSLKRRMRAMQWNDWTIKQSFAIVMGAVHLSIPPDEHRAMDTRNTPTGLSAWLPAWLGGSSRSQTYLSHADPSYKDRRHVSLRNHIEILDRMLPKALRDSELWLEIVKRDG